MRSLLTSSLGCRAELIQQGLSLPLLVGSLLLSVYSFAALLVAR